MNGLCPINEMWLNSSRWRSVNTTGDTGYCAYSPQCPLDWRNSDCIKMVILLNPTTMKAYMTRNLTQVHLSPASQKHIIIITTNYNSLLFKT